jgi:signal transduction histidine kinase
MEADLGSKRKGNPVSAEQHSADHRYVTMARLRLYALTTVGGLSLVYEFVTEAMSPQGLSLSDSVWILIVIPMYAVGAWLTWRLPTHPQPVRLLVSGTAFVVGGAFGTLIASRPQMINSPWAPVLSMLSLEAQAVGSLAVMLLIGSYPDGFVERRWQRLALRCSWVVLIAPPLALLALPVVPVSQFDDVGLAIPNPYAVSWLAWLAEPATWLALNSWWVVLVSVLVLCARFVAADAAGRAQMRVFFIVVLGLLLYFAGSVALALGAPEDSALVITLMIFGSLTAILLPGAIIYGILRHRLFDLDLVVRKSVAYGAASLLIAAAYAVIAATPGLMLGNRVPVALAVVITIAAALAFQPLRRRLESAVSRRLFGDRVRQYQLLKNLGVTMEQTAELDELLPRLAHAVRDGIGASWVRVRLRDADGSWLDEPVGVAGEVSGEIAAGIDLARAGELLGRVDLGPKPGGYAPADLELLTTVAAQATTAVANVRLASQLKEGLEELSTSRVRLIAAQDAERRRIERDLHDGIQQEVVALIAGLRLARNRLSRDQLTAVELTDLQDQAREMLRDLRELAHGIHPPVLSDNGLVAALESRATRFPISVQILADDGLRAERFSEDVEGTAYFVACESLTNVAKHAGTAGARIRLSHPGGRLCLVVEDDGRGFEPNGARSGGLANIRDRVEALHGRLTIESRLGAGTSVRAELPLSTSVRGQ